MEQLAGTIEAIVFAHPENGFTVARLKEVNKKDFTVIVGTIPHLQPGESVICKGEWRNHQSHVRHCEVKENTVDYPSELMWIQKYQYTGL